MIAWRIGRLLTSRETVAYHWRLGLVPEYIRAQELWSRGLQAPLWSCRSRPVLRNLWPRAPPRSRGRRPQRAPLWSCRSRPVLRNPRLSAPPRSRGRRPTLRLLVPAGSGCASGCCSVTPARRPCKAAWIRKMISGTAMAVGRTTIGAEVIVALVRPRRIRSLRCCRSHRFLLYGKENSGHQESMIKRSVPPPLYGVFHS
eukprot:COSAG03_NODE_319_length_9037_cov_15.622287_1_plen_200_part_00